jgi:hypothetical protein
MGVMTYIKAVADNYQVNTTVCQRQLIWMKNNPAPTGIQVIQAYIWL